MATKSENKDLVKQWVNGSNPNQPLSWAWFKGLWNDWTGNTQIDKQLSAQKEENALSREWNLELAKKQNAWNRDQWERENAYNSPAAQVSRLKAAGLNPALMYGGVDNASASSPAMTSGSPYNPMDWSALGSKKTIGASIMEGLAIQQARANIKKTEGEAKQAGMNADILEKYGLEGAQLNNEYLREQVNKLAVEAQNIDFDNTAKQLEFDFRTAFRDDIIKNKIESLRASTKMTENALKEDIETLALRIAGINAENSRLERMSNFTTSEWRLVFDVVRELINIAK